MSNPHVLVSTKPLVVNARMCAECDTPLIEVPAGKQGWYCIKCKFYPSMQDTWMKTIRIKE